MLVNRYLGGKIRGDLCFPKRVSPKENVIARLEFELTAISVKYISHYAPLYNNT